MIAIKFGDLTDARQLSGLLFLDAVTSYDKSWSGSVTEHPVESGVSISDHYISRNPTFTIEGVFSGVDISPIPWSIQVDGFTPLNANPPPTHVSVNNVGAGLLKWLPDSVTQFLPNSSPTIIGSTERRDSRKDIEELLETIMNGVYINEETNRWENRMTLSTIYETDMGQLGKSYPDVVMTGYSVSEGVDSGEGMFVTLTFEQVRFATSESVDAPSPASGTPTARGASKSKNKGPQSTSAEDATGSKANDPYNAEVFKGAKSNETAGGNDG